MCLTLWKPASEACAHVRLSPNYSCGGCAPPCAEDRPGWSRRAFSAPSAQFFGTKLSLRHSILSAPPPGAPSPPPWCAVTPTSARTVYQIVKLAAHGGAPHEINTARGARGLRPLRCATKLEPMVFNIIIFLTFLEQRSTFSIFLMVGR